MKTILFLSSELPSPIQGARCNDLYKIIDRHLSQNKAKSFFRIDKWDQPTGEEVLEKIKEHPNYIHYCGHGDSEGNIRLPGEDGETYALKTTLIEEYLRGNTHLECLFLGSCNSDKLVEKLKHLAEYSIGFTNSPTAEFVNGFYDRFYEQLARYGAPFKAFIYTRDRLMAKKAKTIAGAQAIFRSKNNYVMELLALNEQRFFESAGMEEAKSAVLSIRTKLASLEEEVLTYFEQLLVSHPFAEEIFSFYSSKEKLAYDIASQVMAGADEDDCEYFKNQLFITFEVLEKVLAAFEDRKLSRNAFLQIAIVMEKGAIERALKLLENHELFENSPAGFKDLLAESNKYCLKTMSKSWATA